jgi:hypothetical protein
MHTSKKTQYFTITNINRLMLFKKIIAVYSEKDTNFIKYEVYKLAVVKINSDVQ